MELHHAERMDTVADQLESLSDERFDIRHVYTRNGSLSLDPGVLRECGTTACIVGWAEAVARSRPELSDPDEPLAGQPWLGLNYRSGEALFMPPGFREYSAPGRYTRRRAIAVLRDLAEQVRTSPDGEVWPRWDRFDADGKMGIVTDVP